MIDLGKKKEKFHPNCKTSREDGLIICEPKWTEDGKVMTSERPIVLDGTDSEHVIIDDGGAPDYIIEKTREWIRKHSIYKK